MRAHPVRKVNGAKVITHEYASMGEFLDAAAVKSETIPGAVLASREGSEDFTGSASMDEAQRLARDGWHEVRSEVNKLVGDISSHVAEVIDTGYVWSMDVTGEFVDVPSFLMGEPECMFSVTLAPVAKQGNVVTVLIQASASSSVKTATMKRRGAVLLALCEILKTRGYSLEIWQEQAVKAKSSTDVMATLVKVKSASEPTDVDSLMFPLAHPSMLRRMTFSVEESLPTKERRKYGFLSGGGYGYPVAAATSSDIVKADVVVGSGITHGQQGKLDSDPVGWILDTLTGLGLVTS